MVKRINTTVSEIKYELENKLSVSDLLRNFGKVKGNVLVKGKTFVKNAEVSGKINGMFVIDLLYDTFR